MLQAISRQFFLFVFIFGLGITLTILTILYAPRKYQSHSKLMVGLGRENVALDPTATIGETAAFHRTPDFEIESTMQAMQSRDIMEQVVDRIGPDRILGSDKKDNIQESSVLDPEVVIDLLINLQNQIDPVDDRELATNRLFKGLTIEARRNSSVIEVRFLAKTPELAQEINQTWTEIFRAEHSNRSDTGNSVSFFEEVEQKLLEELENVRQEYRSKKTAFGLVTTGGGQRILEQQLELAKTALIQTQIRLANSKSRLESLATQEAATDRFILTSDATAHTSDAQQSMRSSLYALEIQLEELASKYGPEHPQYINLQRQVDEARQIYESQSEGTRQTMETLNPLYVHLLEQIADERSNADGFQGELKAVEDSVATLTLQLEQMNAQEMELATLERKVEVLENQYRLQYAKLEQARLAQQLERTEISNLKVVQKPSFEQKPASPSVLMCALLGTIASLMAAFGLVTIRESSYQINRAQQETVMTAREASAARARSRQAPRTPERPARSAQNGSTSGSAEPEDPFNGQQKETAADFAEGRRSKAKSIEAVEEKVG